jgi:hypothetical protein
MRLVDRSVSIEADAPFEAFPVKVEFRSHDGAELEFFKQRFGVTEADLVYSGHQGDRHRYVRLRPAVRGDG